MRICLVVLGGALLTVSTAQADLPSCPQAPLVADESFKASAQGAAQALLGLLGQANLETRLETTRTDVFSKYPNAGDVRMQAYFAFVLCTQVLSDSRLSPQDKLRYSLLLLPDTPIAGRIKQEAMKAIRAGDYERAQALLTAAQNQISAVLLIEDGHPDVAIANLEQTERLLGDIHTETSAKDRLQRGYNYKTYAQGFAALGDTKREQEYLDLALKTFEQVKNDPKLDDKTTNEFAGAINGIGNIHFQRGQYRESIADYQVATSMLPNYAYAWHDMFLAYYAMAKQGEVDLPGMRKALARMKETRAGWPGLDTGNVARLETMLAEVEQPSGPSHRTNRR